MYTIRVIFFGAFQWDITMLLSAILSGFPPLRHWFTYKFLWVWSRFTNTLVWNRVEVTLTWWGWTAKVSACPFMEGKPIAVAMIAKCVHCLTVQISSGVWIPVALETCIVKGTSCYLEFYIVWDANISVPLSWYAWELTGWLVIFTRDLSSHFCVSSAICED